MAMPAWIAEVGVAGTWAIAALAIWGEKIRSSVFKPHLVLDLLSDRGELIPLTSRDPPIQSRFYHLKVRNLRRRFPAANGPDGLPVTEFAAMLPLGWRHPQIHPTEMVVGPERHADFFVVTDEPKLTFVPIIRANNFRAEHIGRTKLWVTLLARAVECDSDPITVEIAWDGKWADGEAEMKRHLTISVVAGKTGN